MDPRRLLPVLAAIAAACVVATLVVGLTRPGRSPGASRPEVPASSERPASGPRQVLARWDERRAAAWAAGDVRALRMLYAAGSRTGQRDVELLRHYLARGLRVEGLTTQVLALEVVSRTPRRLTLDVTDRVAGGAAVGGPAPIPLPADRASARRVVLVRPGDVWLVAEARDREGNQDPDQARAAASTSRTSSSSKS